MGALDSDVRYLKGVGEARARALNKLGIVQVRDLLRHFPRSYEDRTSFYPIMAAPLEETVCIRALVATEPRVSEVRRGMRLVKFRAVDDSGSVDITYFNQVYVRDQIHRGESYIFCGKLSGVLTRRTMTNPDFEPEDREGQRTGRILPRYPLSAGLSNRRVMQYVRSALDLAEGELPEALPAAVREEYGLASAGFAYENIHFPADFRALELARNRLAFEEMFVLGCALGRLRRGRESTPGRTLPPADPEGFYRSLAFSPTAAQRRAVQDALADMSSGRQMNRLVQGDVGSGKTLVAAACIWAVCRTGRQAAFMAPTELLAEQHLVTLRNFLQRSFGIRVEKLTGAMTVREKREIKEGLQNGEIQLVVGTHALLTEDVQFQDLALVVTDEQHRFGVQQRGALSAKAAGTAPHVLVMSATPIPRTLALMIYGDLDVSVIDELPPGRQRVDTFAVDERYRARLNGFIATLAGEGRQIFVVCPMVEENEDYDPHLKSATEHAEVLRETFPTLRVACIHGRMKSREKDEIMAAVVAGTVDILVSTTVIEVGVDVPNAALMIVENAERFGLSQLHQLRGRVGRGSCKSWCILVSDATGEEARARLKILCQTNDGFQISEEDLRLRGPGDFFGSRQHGLPESRIADLGGDTRLMQAAQSASQNLLAQNPTLAGPELAPLREQVERLFAASGGAAN